MMKCIRGCLTCEVTRLCNCFFSLLQCKYSTESVCNSLSPSLHFFKMRPLKRLATETKRGAPQHTFGCRTFPLSFSITNGGYLSLSVELNFFFPFHVGTAYFHALTQLSTALTSSDTHEQFFST